MAKIYEKTTDEAIKEAFGGVIAEYGPDFVLEAIGKAVNSAMTSWLADNGAGIVRDAVADALSE